MKAFFLLFCLLFSSCLVGSLSHESTEVVFKEANPIEAQQIEEEVVFFYVQMLLDAGLFENWEEAQKAAKIEMQNEEEQNRFYYFLVSKNGKKQYGYIVYSITGRTAYLDAIYLAERFRGHGLGRKTLQRLEETLANEGVKAIRLYVFNHNKIAFALYRKMGYAIEKTYYQADATIGHHMRKEIQK
jgi:ribosomal protein S18 acetylase RimI-like enzyme